MSEQLELPVAYELRVESAAGILELFDAAYRAMRVRALNEARGLALWSRIREEQLDPDNAPLV